MAIQGKRTHFFMALSTVFPNQTITSAEFSPGWYKKFQILFDFIVVHLTWSKKRKKPLEPLCLKALELSTLIRLNRQLDTFMTASFWKYLNFRNSNGAKWVLRLPKGPVSLSWELISMKTSWFKNGSKDSKKKDFTKILSLKFSISKMKCLLTFKQDRNL